MSKKIQASKNEQISLWARLAQSGLIAKFSDQINHFWETDPSLAQPSMSRCVYIMKLGERESKKSHQFNQYLFGIILIQESIEGLLSQSNQRYQQSLTGQHLTTGDVLCTEPNLFNNEGTIMKEHNSGSIMHQSLEFHFNMEPSFINNNIWFSAHLLMFPYW